MAKMENIVNVSINIKIKVSLWDTIKFRIMGKEMKKAFLNKFEPIIQEFESNPDSNHLR